MPLDKTSYIRGYHTVSSSTESRMFAEVIIEIFRNRLWSVICKNHNNTDEQGSQWQQEAPCCYGGAGQRAKIRSSFRRRVHGKRARTGEGNMWTRDLGRRRETGPPGQVGTSGLGNPDQSTRLEPPPGNLNARCIHPSFGYQRSAWAVSTTSFPIDYSRAWFHTLDLGQRAMLASFGFSQVGPET